MSNFQKKTIMWPLTLGVLVLLTMPSAWAQSSAITGTVTDATQAVLPGVEVEVTNTETGVTRTLVSSDVGRYTARGLIVGVYRVSAAITGFKTAVRTDIHVSADSDFVVDLTLEIGNVTEEVTVMGGAELVQTTSISMQSLIDEVAIRELPLNGRDYMQLATLQPGVLEMRGQRQVRISPQSGTGMNLTIAGARPNSNIFKLDGITTNDQANSSPGAIGGENFGVEAIREFSVLTNTYSTEYGRGSGGVVSAVLRSGTNELHGSLWFFHRNRKLDARNFFDPGEVPNFRRHQFGAAAGGPIVQDKTFIFGSYEGLRQFREQTGSSPTVPSVAAKAGNLVSGTVVVDPKMVPTLALWPDPTTAVPENLDVGKLQTASPTTNLADFFTIRVDHQINDNNSINSSYLIEDATLGGRDTLNLSDLPSLSRRQLIMGQWTSLISPTVINTFRMGYSRPHGATGLLIPDNPALRVFDPIYSTNPLRPPPIVRVSGLEDFFVGEGSEDLEGLLNQSTQFYEDLSWLNGNHDIKMGFSVEFLRPRVDAANRENGRARFGSVDALINNEPTEFATQFAGSDTRRFFRQSIWGGYIQDNWQISSNFMLTLGLRYEMVTQVSELEGEESRSPNPFRDTFNDLVLGDGYFGDLPRYDMGNFAPRVGFAWDAFGNGKTAIRGGFGIFADQFLVTFLNLPALRMPPFFSRSTFSTTGTELFGSFPDGIFDAAGFTGGQASAFSIDPLERDPSQAYRMQFNLNIQQELAANTVGSVAYVGGSGRHFMGVDQDQNLAATDVVRDGALFFPADSPNRTLNFARIGARQFNRNNHYHSLQMSINRRFAEGFRAQASYTWSKALDDGSSIFAATQFDNGHESPFAWNTNLQRGPADYDVRQQLVINGTYDLPLGEGALLDGWQITGIFRGLSGVPFSMLQDGDRPGTASRASGTQGGQKPDLVPGADNQADPSGGDKTLLVDLNNFQPTQITCSGGALGAAEELTRGTCGGTFNDGFEVNPDGSQGDPINPAIKTGGFLGNLGRNTLTGDGITTLDLSIIKTTPLSALGENGALEFRAEFFNILNHADFQYPFRNAQIAFNEDGAIVGAPGVSDSTITSSREIQFGLKINF